MWLQYYQPLIADLVQKALIRLCQDHIPHTDKLEIDGIVCISCGTVEKQIVVKVHDVIGTERSDPQLKAHILQVPGFKRKLTNRDNGDDDGTMPKLSRAEATLASAPVDLSTHEAASDVNTDDSDSGRESPDDKPAQKSVIDNAQPRLQRGVSLLKLLSESPSFNPVTATINRDDNDSCSSSESNICHKRDTEIRCRVCGDEFKTVQALQSHISSVHKRYLCKHCFNTFSLRCNLNRHERLHTGVKPFPCSHCNRSFARNADLRLHMQKHESENQPDSSICQFCKKEFSQRQELLFHLFKVHKVQDGIFACTICEQVFEDEEKYNEHWDSHTASLQQHGKIEVSPRLTINKIPPSLTPVENPAGDQSKKTPPVLWREKPYKSLLPPKLKPLFVNVNKDAVQVCQGDASSSESPIPMHDAVDEGVSDKVTCGVDLDSIKREFGPLFHYNDESIADTGELQDDCCADDSPESRVKQESEDSAKIYSVVEPTVKSKRKNRPQRVVSGNHDEGSPSTGRKSSAVKTESVSILNKSTSLLSGVSVTEKKNESIITNLQTTPKKEKREVVLAEILEESSLSPSPNIKDVERDGHCSPSLDALADDESSYECRYGGCGIQLHSFKAYEDHFYISHGRYPCKICEQSFTCKNNRTRHVRNHLGLAKKHGCEYCNKVFSRPDTLQEHKFIHTKSYQQDQCNGCGATFDRKAVLLSHIKKCLKSRANLLEEDLKNDSTQENGEVN